MSPLSVFLNLSLVAGLGTAAYKHEEIQKKLFNPEGSITDAELVVQKQQIKALADGVLRDAALTGEFPKDFAKYIRDNFKNDAGGEMNPNDAWGTPYGLDVERKEGYFEVYSNGPDKEPGTEDDIVAKRMLK